LAHPYKIELTATAEQSYERVYSEAKPHLDSGETSHRKVKLLRFIDECIDKIIPYDPFNAKRALVGALSNVFRVKKGRIRICYIGSSRDRLRIPGDVNGAFR
jgi:mRNA-degrading endonuclease RelE of RelBE toxin-antitoxin system